MAICFLQPNRLYNVLNTHGYQFDQDKNLTHMIDLFMNDKLLSGFSRITHRHQYDAVLDILEQYGFVKKMEHLWIRVLMIIGEDVRADIDL